ncbi:MAG: SDR family oxidoreductase [Bacteroidota bacterium]
MADTPVYAVLGATGGIGSALTRSLAATGARLALGARSVDKLRDLAGETGAAAYTLDATQLGGVQSFVQSVLDQYGRLDGIANCVGSIILKPAHLTSEEEFEQTLRLNLHSAFFVVKTCTKVMQKQKSGSIVLVSSIAAHYGLQNHEAIAAAKGGVASLVRAAAASYAHRGVRVNAVSPGLVRTPMAARLTASEAAEQQSAKMHALGRIGEPTDVAPMIHHLLDAEKSGWITGQVISVDGGFATVKPR